MKRFKVLVVVGGVLLIVGILIALGSPANGSKDSTFTIPNGAGYYYQYTFSGTFAGEQIDFSYAVQSSGTVDVYVLNAAQYSSYAYDLTVTSSLYANPGTVSGTGSVAVPESGTYYLVINHGSGFASSSQDGQMSIRTSGLNVPLLAAGIVLAAAGIVLLALGYRLRTKALAPPPGYLPPSQVLMFPPAGQGLPPTPQQPLPQSPPPQDGQPPKSEN